LAQRVRGLIVGLLLKQIGRDGSMGRGETAGSETTADTGLAGEAEGVSIGNGVTADSAAGAGKAAVTSRPVAVFE